MDEGTTPSLTTENTEIKYYATSSTGWAHEWVKLDGDKVNLATYPAISAGEQQIQISFKGFRPSAKAIGRIYTVGLPSIAMQCVGSLMTFGMNLILMSFSATAVAVFGVYFKLQSFVFMPIFGLNNGMVPIISYNYGARRPDRVKKTIKLAVCYAEGIMLVRFGRTVVDAMPQREYDAQDDAWREVDEPKRAAWATEHDARIALTLAAACFASGARIMRCYVQIAAPDGEQGERVVETYSFGRAAYLADCVSVAKDLESMDMDDMPCKHLLEAYEADAPDMIEPAEVHARPRDDHRPLPPALRDLLLADTADELEVMEEDNDPYIARVVELREQSKVDRAGAFEGFSRLVEELEAKCTVAELLATGPVQTQFCDNQLVRMVLPVMAVSYTHLTLPTT